MWSRYPRYRKEDEKRIVILILASLLIYLLWFIWVSVGAQLFPSVVSVDAELSKAAQTIVVRFPESSSYRQEEVIIRRYYDAPSVLARVFVTQYGERQHGNVITLTDAQWDEWNSMRIAWCMFPPYQSQKHTLAFEIGVNCPAMKGIQVRKVIFWIEPPTLPSKLRTLLQDTPSPGCPDALCGW